MNSANDRAVRLLREHLAIGVKHAPERYPIEKFILTFGRHFLPAALLPVIKRGRAKQCYQNAADLALGDELKCDYAEGFAYDVDGGFPFGHAWCVQRRTAIDPTLKSPERYAYLGVIVPRRVLIETLEKQGHYGILTGELGDEFMQSWARRKRR